MVLFAGSLCSGGLGYGAEGDDVLFGGSGDDFLDGGPNTDNGDGGADKDTCFNLDTQTNCESQRRGGRPPR